MESRERLVDNASAILFLTVALAIALFLPSERDASPVLIAALTLAYAVVSRVRFEYASFWVSPEQIVLVAMLALLPLPLIPLVVAAALVIAALPEITAKNWHRDRWVTPAASCWFCIGPVLVLAALAPGDPTFADADIYVLAFTAQLAGDLCWAIVRDGALLKHAVEEVIRAFADAARVDAILAPLGFVVSVAAVQTPLALVTIGPLIWLLELFSRDREARYTATLELNRAYRGTVMLLSDVIEFDDAYTGTHSRSVVDLVRGVSEELEVNNDDRQELDFAALLHDVGKIVIPKEIINKPAALTDEEFELIKTHTIEGQFMLDRVGGLLGRVGEIVRSCHERWDGAGYPDGLAGEDIPLASRIVFACDAFNAMTTDRPYRLALSRDAAVGELEANAGTQFDPDVVAALTRVVALAQPRVAPEVEIRALLSATAQRGVSAAS